MKIAVCDDDRAIREELFRLIQKQVSEVDIVRYQSGQCKIDRSGKPVSEVDIVGYQSGQCKTDRSGKPVSEVNIVGYQSGSSQLPVSEYPVSEVNIVGYQSGEEMINTRQDFDIYFLDIEMGKVSGMDIARRIREQEESGKQRSIIIFVTGYREYMEAAFDVNAFHYLVKPIDAEKFSEVFSRAWREVSACEERAKKYIMVKSSGTQWNILLKDIYYIESSNKKVIIHTTDGTRKVYGKMEELENGLGNTFFRCHRCYLVNMEKISAYSADHIQVTNGDNLLLARKKYSDFIRTYMRYVKNGGIVNV